MSVSESDVNAWFAANPGATQNDVAAAVQSIGGLEANPGLAGMLANVYQSTPENVSNYYNNYTSTTPAAPATVDQLYQQILGRAPDAGGAAYWQQQFGNTIDANELAQFKNAAAVELAAKNTAPTPDTNVNLANRVPDGQDAKIPRSFYTSNEAPAAPTTVEELYQQILGRAPDAEGLKNWKQQFGNTIEPDEITKFKAAASAELAASGKTARVPITQAEVDKWFADHPGATESDVAAAVKGLGGITANPGLADLLANRYQSTPENVSKYYKDYTNAQNEISKLYETVLGRKPDEAGLAYWAKQFGNTIDPNEIAQFKEAAAVELYGPNYNNPDKPYLDYFKTITPSGELTPGNFGRQTALDLAWSGKLDQDSYTKVLQNSPNRTEIESIRGLGKDILDKAPKNVDPSTLNYSVRSGMAFVDVGNGVTARYDKSGNLQDFSGSQVWPLVPDGQGGYKSALPKDTIVYSKWDVNGKSNLMPVAAKDNSFAGLIKEFGFLPDIAVAIATGGSSLPVQLASKAALDLARGATPMQVLQGGISGYLAAGIANYTGLSDAIKTIDSPLLQDVAKNASLGGISAGISGRNIGQGITVGAVSGAVSNIGNQYLTDTSLTAVQRNALMSSATAYAQSIASGQSGDAALKNAMMAGGKAAGTQFAKDLDKEYGITDSLKQLPGSRQPTNGTVTALANGLEIGNDFIPFDYSEDSITSLIDGTDYTGGTGATFDINDMNYGSTTGSAGGASGNTGDNQTITTFPGEEALNDLSESGVIMPDGSYKTWAELDEMAGVEPGTIYTDGGTTITEEELQAILDGTYTSGTKGGGSGVKAGGSGTTGTKTGTTGTKAGTATTPKTTTTTPKTTTTTPKTTTTTTTSTKNVLQTLLENLPKSQTQNMDLLGLLALLAGGGSQAAPTVVSPDVSEIKLMEDIFGTELSARPPTKKYYGGGDVDSLLKIIRS